LWAVSRAASRRRTHRDSATWAVLQAVDGVALKQAVDAWVAASGTEEATRFADAETARWIEWGLQSYFRVLLGVAFLLLGSAAVVSRLVPSWLGVLLAVGGLLSLAVGFSVAYTGLESGFQDAVGIALRLVVLVFIVGLLVVARRAREPATRAARKGKLLTFALAHPAIALLRTGRSDRGTGLGGAAESPFVTSVTELGEVWG
jgi:hypothetical protein